MKRQFMPSGYWRKTLFGAIGIGLMALLPSGAYAALPDGDYKIVEAEDFVSNTTECNQTWTLTPPMDGNQTPHMRALPDLGESYPDPEDPRLPTLEYSVDLQANTHYHVWVRGRAQGGDNSFYWSTNHQTVRLGLPSTGTFEWSNMGTITTGDDSNLSFEIKMREDGLSIDKYAFIADDNYTPSAEGPILGQRNLSPGIRLSGSYYVGVDEATMLSADVVDDGLPFGTLEYAWSKAEGPGDVLFSHPDQVQSQAFFTEPGSYTLSFTAFDGAARSESKLLLEVVQFPLANQVHRMVNGLMVIDFEHPAGIDIEGEQWRDITAPGMGGSSVQECAGGQECQTLSFHVEFPNPGFFAVWFKGVRTEGDSPTPTAVEVSIPTERDSPTLRFSPRSPTSYWVRRTSSDSVAYFTVTQAGSHRLTVRNLVGATAVGIDRLLITSALSYSPRRSEPNETLFILDKNRPNFSPFILSIDGPGSTFLEFPTRFAADVTDDGKPNNSLSYEWSMLDGPQAATFSNPDLPETDITFHAQGSYTIRLTVDDGELSTYRDFSIDAAGFRNEAPEVSTGDTLKATHNLSTLLFANVQDDGHPNGQLEIQWSQIDGPADITFDAPNNARSTFVTFPELGHYTMQVRVSDGELETTAELDVSVVPPNDPPAVDVGPDRIIDVDQALSLSAEVSDDGRPAGSSLSLQWSQIIGPEDAQFSPVDQAQTEVTFTAIGEYRLELSASDSEKSSSDSLNVTVEPANVAPTVDVGPDLEGEVSKTLNITATIEDDGKPNDPPALRWHRVSGPAALVFDGATDEATVTIGFTEAGDYVLALEADDGALVGSDELSITVFPENTAPVVDAGEDLVVRIGDRVALNGDVSDDGRPNETMLVEWSLIEGPGFSPVFQGASQDGKDETQFDELGIYRLRLSAHDGEFESIDDIRIEVRPQNQAPVVEAGEDLQGRVGTELVLPGTVTDDGEPDGSLIVYWSQASGPAEVTFGETSQEGRGTAQFTEAGDYVLVLKADDTDKASKDEINVTVRPENQAPVVDAGDDQPGRVGTTLELAGSVTDDGEPDDTLEVTWTQVSGPADVTFGETQKDGKGSVDFAEHGTYVLRLTASDGEETVSDEMQVTVRPENQAPVVDAGADQPGRVGTTLNLAGSVTDDGEPDGTLNVTWTQVDGPADVTFGATGNDGSGSVNFAAAGTYTLRLTASDGEETVSDEMQVTVRPENQAPVVNAGADQPGRVGTTLNLAGSVTDDGEPDGTLNVTWTQVDGPADATFGATGNDGSGSVNFAAAGTYTLRLTASDGEETVSDEMQVTVRPENQAPVVNAGADQPGRVGTTLNLAGSVTDDGEPDGTLNVTWTQVDGPADATFGATGNDGSGSVNFAAAGTYTLRLTASDGEETVSDEMQVTVRPENQAPVVNAGADAQARVGSVFTFSGSVSDDGEPDGTLNVLWRQISGPANAIINADNTGAGTASFNAAGTYELELVANDGQYESSDRVNITVRPENQAPVVSAGDNLVSRVGQTLTINGNVSDDGEPNGALDINWQVSAGPAPVQLMGDTNSPVLRLGFTQAGTYTFTLSANDGQYISTDSVDVQVRAANQAPFVDAGEDVYTITGATVLLNGIVTDDGEPNGTLITEWSWISGPIAPNFTSSTNQSSVELVFFAPGEYVLQLSANDSQYQTDDQVTIFVEPANHAPEVNAGADFSARSEEPVQLSGSFTDDGEPNGTLSGHWHLVSGPAEPSFEQGAAPGTATVVFPMKGVYTLGLTVTDGDLSTTDQVLVNVIGSEYELLELKIYSPAEVITGEHVELLGRQLYPDLVNPVSHVAWRISRGSPAVIFTDASSPDTKVMFPVAGLYEVEYTVVLDSGTARSTTQVIDVQGGSSAGMPHATSKIHAYRNASGSDLSIDLEHQALVYAEDEATITSTWQVLDGPGNVIFTQPAHIALNGSRHHTQANFSLPGVYHIAVDTSIGSEVIRTERFVSLPLSDAQANGQGSTPEAMLWAGRDRISDSKVFSLNAMVNFMEIPQRAATVNWRLSTSQGSALIDNPTVQVDQAENLLRTNVEFSTPGFYSFELSMVYNGVTYTDLVRVEYRPPNMTDFSYWSQLFTQMMNFMFNVGDDD